MHIAIDHCVAVHRCSQLESLPAAVAAPTKKRIKVETEPCNVSDP